jgi:integrase
MASIEKRVTDGGTSYRVKVRLKGFPPESATFERMTDAKAWAAKTEADMKAGRHFGASKRHTFADLANEYAPHAKDGERLAYWRGVFGPDNLDALTPSRIAKERDKLLAEDTDRTDPATGKPRKRTGATVNRYLAALSVCLSYAVKELQWLERNPVERIKKPSENKGRVRFLSDDERTRLLTACRPHADLYLAVVLSLTTGARQSEVMTLRFGQIDFSRRVITLHDTKNGSVAQFRLLAKPSRCCRTVPRCATCLMTAYSRLRPGRKGPSRATSASHGKKP